MCLVPGMLAPGPSRPSASAGRLATGLLVLTCIQLVASLGLIVSFSVWAVLLNLLFVVYAYAAVVRPFRQDVPLVFVENIICFSIMSAINGILNIFTMVDLATRKQVLSEKLKPWQFYAGLTFFGLSTACFLFMSVLSLLLYRDLRETTIQLDEESAPFIVGRRGNGRAPRGAQSSSFGSFGYPPTGTYASGSGSRTSTTTVGGSAPSSAAAPSRDRFPGKGYKLNE
ncbi:Hypothetical Protein FCC1311_039742 [Hondaea fermentalgiana]|uniref:MARVEL domain-containing protein n=1 Tax=Hondaea fermentalgiana TaxID=2315210 RepID=A0A2R5GHI6_9STRA|nr:Hypothetical Protein FCC1311_039742 [Hondaea fermentalgiana]|eukprot:GBG27751.1 Hypothetical Protein FCC1311_039742 [Hondaea fermentalgiana]